MGHPILTLPSCIALAGFTSFCFYLSGAYRGPWTSKYDQPPETKERYRDIPEFATLFRPDSHPALRRDV